MADWDSTRRAYDALARGYPERAPDLRAEQPLHRAMIGAFAEYVRAEGDPDVLDAGCGTGRPVGPLRAPGLSATGVDLSPGMLEVARSVHPDVGFATADLRRMPFAAVERPRPVGSQPSRGQAPPTGVGLSTRPTRQEVAFRRCRGRYETISRRPERSRSMSSSFV